MDRLSRRGFLRKLGRLAAGAAAIPVVAAFPALTQESQAEWTPIQGEVAQTLTLAEAQPMPGIQATAQLAPAEGQMMSVTGASPMGSVHWMADGKLVRLTEDWKLLEEKVGASLP